MTRRIRVQEPPAAVPWTGGASLSRASFVRLSGSRSSHQDVRGGGQPPGLQRLLIDLGILLEAGVA